MGFANSVCVLVAEMGRFFRACGDNRRRLWSRAHSCMVMRNA